VAYVCCAPGDAADAIKLIDEGFTTFKFVRSLDSVCTDVDVATGLHKTGTAMAHAVAHCAKLNCVCLHVR
jgi:hypothetical protein